MAMKAAARRAIQRRSSKRATRRAAKKARKPKAPKAVKATKSKRSTRKARVGTYRQVWNGVKTITRSGLRKRDLTLNAKGKVVSKKLYKQQKAKLAAKAAARKQRRKSAPKLSLRAQRNRVMSGEMEKTKTGLSKDSLTRSKFGKIVSKKKQQLGRSTAQTKGSWLWCVAKARSDLGIKGFCVLNRGPLGKRLYARAKVLFNNGGDLPVAVPKAAALPADRARNEPWFAFGC